MQISNVNVPHALLHGTTHKDPYGAFSETAIIKVHHFIASIFKLWHTISAICVCKPLYKRV